MEDAEEEEEEEEEEEAEEAEEENTELMAVTGTGGWVQLSDLQLLSFKHTAAISAVRRRTT
jgi:CO dehydrogenase/acetyl-CoA synthase beta subunit